MDSRTEVSIIIVTYNSSAIIEDCLQSIYNYEDISKLEIIIVDNASSDITMLKHLIASSFPEVKIINNENNDGYGQGNNIGIKAAKGRYILIMNPDVRLKESIINKGIKQIRDKELVLLGMKQWVSENKVGTSFRWDNYSTNYFSRLILTKLCNIFDIYSCKNMYLVGACFFLDKTKFAQIGLFDEKIFMYNEESDIRNRIINKYGYKSILYDKSLNFIHLSDERPFSFSSERRAIISLMYYAHKFGFNTAKILKSKKLEKRLLYLYCKLFKHHRDLDELRKTIAYIDSCIRDTKAVG